MKTEQQWIRRAREGDVEAFGLLYGQVYEDLYRFAFFLLKNGPDAEDAVGETVTSAFASIGRLKRTDSFRSWIFRILSNKCKDRMREYTRQRQNQEPLEDCDHQIFTPGPEEEILMDRMLEILSEEDRRIIGLHLLGGYKTKEIAEYLKLNENTVRARKSRALKKLSDSFQS